MYSEILIPDQATKTSAIDGTWIASPQFMCLARACGRSMSNSHAMARLKGTSSKLDLGRRIVLHRLRQPIDCRFRPVVGLRLALLPAFKSKARGSVVCAIHR